MRVRILKAIDEVPAAQWNALTPHGDPLLRHEFLGALERSACVDEATGWIPHHLVLEDEAGLLAAMPLYLKTHSWGEFVFDWSWARAYAQAGLPYYPKLLSMVPFTPASGARLLVAPRAPAKARQALIDALLAQARAQGLSSAHVLFTTDEDRTLLAGSGFLVRQDCQFHWHNRGYGSFGDFLATFRADKRKKALRERRRIAEAGIEFRTLHGDELDAGLWEHVFALSASTFAVRGHEHYLSVEFFRSVAAAMPQAIMVKLAMLRGTPVATAIFYRSADTLYGRYWGSVADFHSLHFETCYYQGIEYCIEHGLRRFEPGTQGEHKVPRGFEPTATWSAHWIADRRFARAIEHFLVEERAAVERYMNDVREHTPFRRDLNQPELCVELK